MKNGVWEEVLLLLRRQSVYPAWLDCHPCFHFVWMLQHKYIFIHVVILIPIKCLFKTMCFWAFSFTLYTVQPFLLHFNTVQHFSYSHGVTMIMLWYNFNNTHCKQVCQNFYPSQKPFNLFAWLCAISHGSLPEFISNNKNSQATTWCKLKGLFIYPVL